MRPQRGDRQEGTGRRGWPPERSSGAPGRTRAPSLLSSHICSPLPNLKIKESSTMPSGPQRESFSLRFWGQVKQLSKTVLRQGDVSVSCGFQPELWQRGEGAKLEMESYL